MGLFDTNSDLKEGDWTPQQNVWVILTETLQVGILDSCFPQAAPAVLSPITSHYFCASDVLINSLGGETGSPRDSSKQFLLQNWPNFL